jgi:hypothetical protein
MVVAVVLKLETEVVALVAIDALAELVAREALVAPLIKIVDAGKLSSTVDL